MRPLSEPPKLRIRFLGGGKAMEILLASLALLVGLHLYFAGRWSVFTIATRLHHCGSRLPCTVQPGLAHREAA